MCTSDFSGGQNHQRCECSRTYAGENCDQRDFQCTSAASLIRAGIAIALAFSFAPIIICGACTEDVGGEGPWAGVCCSRDNWTPACTGLIPMQVGLLLATIALVARDSQAYTWESCSMEAGLTAGVIILLSNVVGRAIIRSKNKQATSTDATDTIYTTQNPTPPQQELEGPLPVYDADSAKQAV